MDEKENNERKANNSSSYEAEEKLINTIQNGSNSEIKEPSLISQKLDIVGTSPMKE